MNERTFSKPSELWTKLHFAPQTREAALTPDGDLTSAGLLLVLSDLYLEGNFGPICKVGRALYSNSAKELTGRYYVLSDADERLVRRAASTPLFAVQPARANGAYLDFTDAGVQAMLGQSMVPALARLLGETDVTFLTTASRDVAAVCGLVHRFERDLLRARHFNASDFTFQTVVSTLHKLMLDPKTASEHFTRQHNHKVRGKLIQNDCSLFDLYVGQHAQVLNSFKQGMFMSVSDSDERSDYRLGKWHGGYNHLGDYNPLHYGRVQLARSDWLDFKLFEVYRDDYTLGQLLDLLRNNEVSHSSLSKRTSIDRMLEIANRNLRGDGEVGPDDARGVHETVVYIGYVVGKLLRIIRCWRTQPY